MTNLTNAVLNNTNLTNEALPMTTQIDMTNVNKSAFISILSATLHNNGRTPVQSVVIATAMMNFMDELGNCSIDEWVEEVTGMMTMATLKADDVVIDIEDLTGWFDTVVHAGLISVEGRPGERLIDMILTTEKAYPAYASHGVTRRKPIMPYNSFNKLASNVSNLMKNAIDTLQATEYVVDEFMIRIANNVTGSDEQYVIDGCNKLISDGNTERVSEFFSDRRGRMYQGDCHGPNGQSSDMARSLMELAGVQTNYDVDLATLALREEMQDMVCVDLDRAIGMFRAEVVSVKTAAAFIMFQEELKKAKAADTLDLDMSDSLIASKPWSFTKAMRILNALDNGERPYIGMAFGLDAKCSGPQYGAIMTGDREIARACGFTTQGEVDDAYMLAESSCVKAGIRGLDRNLIKTPYMGIFYGQGYMAFADEAKYDGKPGNHDPRLLAILQAIDVPVDGDEPMLVTQARRFHKAVEASFGKMAGLRKSIKNSHYQYTEEGIDVYTTKPTMHNMGDGTYVCMDYKVKTDILGNIERYDVKMPDVTIEMDGFSETFLRMAFKTKTVDLVAHGRSGFVNLIQATDALVARHIVVNLREFGAQHVIAVHDCFRVNINDYLEGRLHNAIEKAYADIFACQTIGNGDILRNYFDAVQSAGGLCNTSHVSAMFKPNGQAKVNGFGVNVTDIAKALGNNVTGKVGSYYFAK